MEANFNNIDLDASPTRAPAFSLASRPEPNVEELPPAFTEEEDY